MVNHLYKLSKPPCRVPDTRSFSSDQLADLFVMHLQIIGGALAGAPVNAENGGRPSLRLPLLFRDAALMSLEKLSYLC